MRERASERMQREIEAMSDRDSVLAEADTLGAECGLIRAQLEEARSILAEDGISADREWYRKATVALRLKGARHQMLLRRAAKLREHDSRASAQAWQQRFIEAARRRLTPESFTAIMEEATDASE